MFPTDYVIVLPNSDKRYSTGIANVPPPESQLVSAAILVQPVYGRSGGRTWLLPNNLLHVQLSKRAKANMLLLPIVLPFNHSHRAELRALVWSVSGPFVAILLERLYCFPFVLSRVLPTNHYNHLGTDCRIVLPDRDTNVYVYSWEQIGISLYFYRCYLHQVDGKNASVRRRAWDDKSWMAEKFEAGVFPEHSAFC